MEINNTTITITPDELETIGSGIEENLKRQAAIMERKTFDLLCEVECGLLSDFMNAGYSIYLSGGPSLRDGRMCHDVDEFIDHLYREKNTTTEEVS